MPDGTIHSSNDAVAAALLSARASLEAQLSQHPDWAAYRALDDAFCADASYAADIEARLAEVPGFKAYRQLHTAVSLLPMRATEFPMARVVQTGGQRSVQPQQTAVEQMHSDATAATTPSHRDDLTRIRGIDAVLARRLAGIGIQRYDQIAAWQHEDVRTIAQALGLGREFIRYGVIEQANWLAAERLGLLERSSAKAREGVAVDATATDLTSVAVWTPHTTQQVDDGELKISTSQSGATTRPALQPFASAIARVRAGCTMNQIVTLASIAPELDQAIFIALEVNETLEVPGWSATPLVPFMVQSQFSLPQELQRTVEERGLETRLVAPGKVLSPEPGPLGDARGTAIISPRPVSRPVGTARPALAATLEPRPVDSAPADETRPLHEIAGRRIDTLEAELDAMTAEKPRVPSQRTSTGARPDAARLQPSMQTNATAQGTSNTVDFAILANVAEADVQIVAVTQPRPSLLAPLPDLPLTAQKSKLKPRHVAASSGQHDGPPLAFAPVEEAAVVIVHRASAASAGSDLAFFAQADAESPAPPARRFLKALTGA